MPAVRDAIRMGEGGAESAGLEGLCRGGEVDGTLWDRRLSGTMTEGQQHPPPNRRRHGWLWPGKGGTSGGPASSRQLVRRPRACERHQGWSSESRRPRPDHECFQTGSDGSGQMGRRSKRQGPPSPPPPKTAALSFPSDAFFLFPLPLLRCKAFHLFLISLTFPKALQLRHLGPSGCSHRSQEHALISTLLKIKIVCFSDLII